MRDPRDPQPLTGKAATLSNAVLWGLLFGFVALAAYGLAWSFLEVL